VSRYGGGDAVEMWRAVITITWPPSEKFPDGRTSTRYDGPFLNKAQATAAINRTRDQEARRVVYYRDATPGVVTGHPERSALTWEKVPA
jgi:hypothetical protein